MVENNNNKQKITLLILQELIWKLEDKINIILECLADHEADIIRLQNSNNLILQRLEKLESSKKKSKKEVENE